MSNHSTLAILGCLDDGWILALLCSLLAVIWSAWSVCLSNVTNKRKKGLPAAPQKVNHVAQNLAKNHPWHVRQYGRFKYCGLRDDPFSGNLHPIYHHPDSPPLPAPQLTATEATGIAVLRASLSDLSNSMRLDDTTLQRFLRARRGNAKKAERLVREAHKLRIEYRMDQLFQDAALHSWADLLMPWYHSGAFLGYGFGGHPVAIERLGWGKFHELVQAVPHEVLLRLDMLHCFRGLGHCEEECVRRGKPFKQAIFVVDAHGLTVDVLRPSVLRAYKRIVTMRDTVLPELSKVVLVVRAPALLATSINSCKRVALTEETAEKVQIATEKDSLSLLRRYLPDETIPAYLGGKLMYDGDPESRRLIAPGGPVPREITDQLLLMIGNHQASDEDEFFDASMANDDTSQETISIGHGSFASRSNRREDEPSIMCCCTTRC